MTSNMGILPQQFGRSNDNSTTRRKSIDHSVQDTIKSGKQSTLRSIPKDSPKNLKQNPLKSNKIANETSSTSSTGNPHNAEKRNIFTEYSVNDSNLCSKLEFSEASLKEQKNEAVNKYVEQALERIQFTLKEANDLEEVITMSNKLLSDSVYVQEVMSRFLVKLDKIETVNNKRLIQMKNEGLTCIQNKIKELVQHSTEIQRTIPQDSFNNYFDDINVKDESYSESVVSNCCNTEQVEEGKTVKKESNKCLKLTTISEDVVREEISNEPTNSMTCRTVTHLPEITDPDQKSFEEKLQLCDSLVIIDKTRENENQCASTVQESESLSFAVDPEQSNSSDLIAQIAPSSFFASNLHYNSLSDQKLQTPPYSSVATNPNTTISNAQKMQKPYYSSFALNPVKHTSNVEKEQKSFSSSFTLNPDQNTNVQKAQNSHFSSFAINRDQNNSSVQKIQQLRSSSFAMNPEQNSSNVQKSQKPFFSAFALNPNQKNSCVQNMQGLRSSSFALNSEQNSSNVQKAQKSISSSFALNPDQNYSSFQKVHKFRSSSSALNPRHHHLKFKRVVDPYMITNHDLCKSATVTSKYNTIQDSFEEKSNYSKRISSEDNVTVTEETRSFRRNVHKVNIKSKGNNRSNTLLPGASLPVRLLVILLFSLLVEISILIIACVIW